MPESQLIINMLSNLFNGQAAAIVRRDRVDRANVAFAKLTMVKDIPGFDNAVIGLGAGIFFIGYFLLEIPGSLIVEKTTDAKNWQRVAPGRKSKTGE